ncbi:hypothetical protein J3D60_004245 [Pseudomonas sp. S3E17]|jgi:hypothetical protein|nr:hypothetical protein [Pseudomonas sp. S3E17]PUB47202.1 hypothetical protein C8K58_102539 [Pseudomonas sp. GV047]
MRKSLLVLLLWAPFAMALLPEPGPRLDQATQQAIHYFLLHNPILNTTTSQGLYPPFRDCPSTAINSLLNKLPTELSTACSGQG